ncbi:MAG TPA: tyrosinase family protein [Rhizomicrobium sp.]|jgi:hypothetical protein|nr:tyrosinase family protein [Rhizomicrobium sp.]
MLQSRRHFVGTAAALGALAGAGRFSILPARADSGPMRIPLSEFVKDAAKLDALRKGVAIMKSRPGSDHRSWFFQAAVHAYNDALYADALKKDRRVGKIDKARYWNKCPHFGQCSADFIIWHRAYVYYFERILRDATGDANFALPYWDYENEDSRSFPEAFAPRYLDAANTSENPLYNPNRDLGFTSGRFDLSSKICEARNTLAAQTFFHDAGTPGFGGDTLDKAHTQLSLIEQRPHNDIHIAVGGVVGSVNGAMADVPTAAFDPIFWVHHANIDRLWVKWASEPGTAWGPLPDDSWFDEKPWVFLNVDGSEARESRRFYMDRTNLDVRYDTDDASRPELKPPLPQQANIGAVAGEAFTPGAVGAAAPDSSSGGGARPPVPNAAAPSAARRSPAPPRMRGGAGLAGAGTPQAMPADMMAALTTQFTIMAITAPLIVSPTRPAKRTVVAAARTGANANARLLLELADIQIGRVPSSGFAVYLDPDSAAPADANMVGLIDLFAATHKDMAGMAGMSAAQRFDVSKIVPAIGGSFSLRIEPYDLLTARNGAGAPQRADAVHIGSVRFIVAS